MHMRCCAVRRDRKSRHLRGIIGNTPIMLMEDGEFCEDPLRLTRVAREDVFFKIRAANALQLNEVRAVVLENTGDISVLHGKEIDEEILAGVRRLQADQRDTTNGAS